MSDKRTDCCITSSTIIQTDCQADWVSCHVFLFLYFFFFLQFLGKLTKETQQNPNERVDGFCILALLYFAFGMMNFLTHLIDVTSLTD